MADDFWAQFMMYGYKITMCDGCRDCLFAHDGSPTRRRDHRRQNYSWVPCFEFSIGVCPDGDLCTYSHGDYEMKYHPQYYKVFSCPDAPNCPSIRFCPYAHTPQEFRNPYINPPSPPSPPPMRRQPNSQTRLPPPPMMQRPNSQTAPPPPPMMQRPRQVQPPSPTDSSGAIPHLQADAASFRKKRKHDHEAGSSNN